MRLRVLKVSLVVQMPPCSCAHLHVQQEMQGTCAHGRASAMFCQSAFSKQLLYLGVACSLSMYTLHEQIASLACKFVFARFQLPALGCHAILLQGVAGYGGPW